MIRKKALIYSQWEIKVALRKILVLFENKFPLYLNARNSRMFSSSSFKWTWIVRLKEFTSFIDKGTLCITCYTEKNGKEMIATAVNCERHRPKMNIVKQFKFRLWIVYQGWFQNRAFSTLWYVNFHRFTL